MVMTLKNKKGCIFCDIVNGRAPSHWIYEDQHVAAFLSLEGHPLIVPKPHFADVFVLDEIHAAAVMQAAVRVAKATKIATQCDGINLVQSNGAAAGQDVFHFHLHIKPRFRDDDVTMSWDTKETDDKIRTKTSAAITQLLEKSS
jgi:histidine triad (HIT) family protein